MIKRLMTLIILLCFSLLTLGSAVPHVQAQSFYFDVPKLEMQVFVEPDASVRIVYDITFANWGDPIDIVDIGLPHENYAISNMRASINNVELTDIRPSEYIDVGVEVHLGDQAIETGEEGTLHFEAIMPDMVWQDTTDKSYASLRITPTWFDEALVANPGYIGVAIHLPEGIAPDEVRYQREPFTSKVIYQGHTVVIWEWPDAYPTERRIVGVSFPKRVMSRVIKTSLGELAERWLKEHPDASAILALLSLVLFGVLFFRFTGGTGCSLFVLLLAGLTVLTIVKPALLLLEFPLLLILVILNEIHLRRKKRSYLPPIAQTEGGGIKRGLTAPEAAVLLELPLNKVLMLVIFGLLQKGIIEIVTQDPLTVRVQPAFRTWDKPENRRSIKKRRKHRRQAALAQGTVVHAYEHYFLDQLERNPGKPLEAIDFTRAMEILIEKTAQKMKGFDLSESQEYYRRIIARAMKQAQSLGDIKLREAYLDKYLPWVMMNDAYPTVLMQGSRAYWPRWGRPVTSGGHRGLAAPTTRSPRASQTTLGDIAASFAGWAENTMGRMSKAVIPSAMDIPGVKGGVIDLSGLDRATDSVFKALASSSGGGRGSSSGVSSSGGSSCACACAGCACACACAGGGR